MIEIYTDGACKSGVGGWAALILETSGHRDMSGKLEDTTSNRMELSAAIHSLESLPNGSEVTIFSDSEYLVKTMTQGWKRNTNLDLWESLDNLNISHKVNWEWVKGHANIPGNEYVNQLAGFEAGVTKTRPTIDKFFKTLDPTDVPTLTHVDPQGRVEMVDVGWKPVSDREATAQGHISMQPETINLIRDNLIKKGDVLTIAQIAGIMGGKRTAELIPLCHPLPLNKLDVELELDTHNNRVKISVLARTSGKTGVEMEALTAASIAALTIYDMCKGVDRWMTIEGIGLVSKSGGLSGDIKREDT